MKKILYGFMTLSMVTGLSTAKATLSDLIKAEYLAAESVTPHVRVIDDVLDIPLDASLQDTTRRAAEAIRDLTHRLASSFGHDAPLSPEDAMALYERSLESGVSGASAAEGPSVEKTYRTLHILHHALRAFQATAHSLVHGRQVLEGATRGLVATFSFNPVEENLEPGIRDTLAAIKETADKFTAYLKAGENLKGACEADADNLSLLSPAIAKNFKNLLAEAPVFAERTKAFSARVIERQTSFYNPQISALSTRLNELEEEISSREDPHGGVSESKDASEGREEEFAAVKVQIQEKLTRLHLASRTEVTWLEIVNSFAKKTLQPRFNALAPFYKVLEQAPAEVAAEAAPVEVTAAPVVETVVAVEEQAAPVVVADVPVVEIVPVSEDQAAPVEVAAAPVSQDQAASVETENSAS